MTSDAHRRFDAPAPPSMLGHVVGTLTRRWGVALAWLVVVAIVGVAACGLLFVDRMATVAIEAGIASTSLFVVVDAKATAVEMDAIGPQIKAMPGVADATLRPRDMALQALVANGLPPPEGRNPLPDVWIVRPSGESTANGATGFAAAIGQLRAALAALPQVVAVRADERWVGQLDRTIAAGRRAIRWTLGIGCAISVVLLGCVGWLAATALAGSSNTAPEKSVLALCGVLVAAVAVLLDAIAIAIFSAAWKPNVVGVIEDTWQRFAANALGPMASTALAVVLISGVAALLARPSCR